jgi:hypothetical protein
VENEKLTAPYASTENVIRVLDKVYNTGVSGPIGSDLLKQLGIGETMVSRTLQALKFIGFIDAEGNEQPLLRQFMVADEQQRAPLLQDAIREAYAVIFRVVDPAKDDRQKIWIAFKVMHPQKQWDRMVTFFLGFCRYAGMEVKDAPANRPAARVTTPKGRPVRRTPKPPTVTPQPPPSPPPVPGNGTVVEKLLEKFPAFNPEWSAEVQEKWFDAFGKLQEQLQPSNS